MTQDKVVEIPEKNLDRIMGALRDANDAGVAAQLAEQVAQERKQEAQRASAALKTIRDLVGEALGAPANAKLDLQQGAFVWPVEAQEPAAPSGTPE